MRVKSSWDKASGTVARIPTVSPTIPKCTRTVSLLIIYESREHSIAAPCEVRYDLAMQLNARNVTWVLCASSLLAASITTPKQLPLRQPAVRAVFPLGGKAGQQVNVGIEGEFLDRASSVGCDCTDVHGIIRKTSALTLAVDLDVPASAQPGLRVMYVETPRGTSNRFFFRVTRWNSVIETEPNDQID